MSFLILGATGATGKYVVEHLISKNQKVKVIVRPGTEVPEVWHLNHRITIIRAVVAEITAEEAQSYVQDCTAVICCLGHVMSVKGIWGKPRNLVVDAVRLFTQAIGRNKKSEAVKFVLMNTIGFQNKMAGESVSRAQQIAIGMIRLLVPAHRDNEQAALYLSQHMGPTDPHVEWVVVRPDNLTTEDVQTAYHTSPVPKTSLFKAAKVSRINVAHFMSQLAMDDVLWQQWRGSMPVIYNSSEIKIASEI